MQPRWQRVAAALALGVCTGAAGYFLGFAGTLPEWAGSDALAAPAPASVRVLYSLDGKRNDKALIKLIDGAESHVYFAIYEFTLADVADALAAAERRGVNVQGLVDAGETRKSYEAPIIARLRRAGIALETERHADGNGIMHVKALVTDSAYAIGSYNWTASATAENDELLEIGTDPALVRRYTSLLRRLLTKYAGYPVAPEATRTFDYRNAARHVGEYAAVRGTLRRVYTAASGTVFLDFCRNYRNCSFSGVIFSDDAAQFGTGLSRYVGKPVTLTGTISSHRGRAEIELSDPSQIAAR
jgi:hypothetical protein